MNPDPKITESYLPEDWIWARVRDRRTDKPAGTVAHLIDTQRPGKTLCGVGRLGLGVSPDATLKAKHRCKRCEVTVKFHPDIEARND